MMLLVHSTEILIFLLFMVRVDMQVCMLGCSQVKDSLLTCLIVIFWCKGENNWNDNRRLFKSWVPWSYLHCPGWVTKTIGKEKWKVYLESSFDYILPCNWKHEYQTFIAISFAIGRAKIPRPDSRWIYFKGAQAMHYIEFLKYAWNNDNNRFISLYNKGWCFMFHLIIV